jgi:phospholipase C
MGPVIARRGPVHGQFQRGELLVARVYEALRRNPELFAKTLLAVTYDEHGGFWDRAKPPTGVCRHRRPSHPGRTGLAA